MATDWYRRLAEVPKVEYPGSPGVDRKHLPGYNTEPKVDIYNLDGRKERYLSWPIRNGTSSASPAKSWQTQPRDGESLTQTVLRQLYETLELPGTLSDYHFAIQQCHGHLWDPEVRRQEPRIYTELYRLCWLNVRLVEAYPSIVKSDQSTGPKYYAVTAFFKLIRLLQNEGYLYEALAVAERAVRFDQQHKELAELRERIAALEAENA